jgi:hypothetical protein
MNQSLRTFSAAVGVSLFISACGGGGGSAPAPQPNINPPVVVTPPVVVAPPLPAPALHAEFIAGQATTPPRYANGTLASAGFNFPAQLAFDMDGNLYVSDADFTVRKITPSGQVSLLAGTAGRSNLVDGTGASASFVPITGMVADASGNVYVSGNTHIRKITPAGVVTTLAGTQWTMGGQDGPGAQATFSTISGLAIDAAGNLYAADNGSLRRVSPIGNVETIPFDQYLAGLHAVALDPKGGFTIADGHQLLLRYDALAKLQQTIDMTDRTDVMPGYQDAPHYNGVSAMAYAPDGLLYVVETTDYASTSDAIRVVDQAGKVTTLHSRLLPAGLANGPLATALFGKVAVGGNGLTVDKAGNLFLADAGNHAIRKISPDRQVSTFAGGWAPPPAFADGSGTKAAFRTIVGFGTDKAGNYYVADAANCAIRKVGPDHVVTTLAGVGGQCGEVDGAGAAARFQGISAMAQAADGTLYVAEKSTVRKLTLDGVVTTLAGSAGTWEKQDGTGKGASFQSVNAISIGSDGNLLVSDGNQVPNACISDIDNTPTSLRRITPQGVVTTLAGTEYQCGQRETAPAMWAASDLAYDGAGNLYLVSGGYLGKRTPDGTATYLFDSKGAKIAAREVVPDDAGNVYFVAEGAVYKYGADRTVTQVLAPTNLGAAVDITPNMAVARVSALTYIGSHKFVASFDDQVVVVTLK